MKTEVSTKQLLEALLDSYVETHDLPHIYKLTGRKTLTDYDVEALKELGFVLVEATKFIEGLKEETSPKLYRVPCSWEVYGITVVEAESWDEAISKSEDAPLPSDGSYIEGSFRIDEELVEDEKEKEFKL